MVRETKKTVSSRGVRGSDGGGGRRAATPKAAASRPATRLAAGPAGEARTSRRGAASPAPRRAAAPEADPPPAAPFDPAPSPAALQEETIESSKYAARAARRFEEERFLFPQSYGVNKVRLLIRDPQWLFAHWDVDPRSFDELRQTLGERVVALSRLTLRVHDALSGGASVALLPFGARSWYVRADATRRSYRAELGVTLPSGEFRLLAESNTVVMPRQSPSTERARQTLRYAAAAAPAPPLAPEAAVQTAAAAEREALAEPGPWQAPPPQEARAPEPPAPEPSREVPERGGASDAFRR